MIAYGSTEHERLWNAFVRRTEPHEKKFGEMVAELFRRQKTSVLAKLNAQRTIQDVATAPFNKAEWVKKFREGARPLYKLIVMDAGQAGLDAIGVELVFDIMDPNVIRFLERRAQRFAREVNDTTWEALKKSLSEGIEAGESIPELADRVTVEMDGRIDSSPETIARTEVIGASNGGCLLSWEQSEVVEGKEWLAALDERTRQSHIDAHGQSVAIDEDFKVGDGSGPAPGQIGLAEEDINCRCTMTAVIKEE